MCTVTYCITAGVLYGNLTPIFLSEQECLAWISFTHALPMEHMDLHVTILSFDTSPALQYLDGLMQLEFKGDYYP